MVTKITIMGVLEPFLSQPKESLHLANISKSIKEPHPTVRQWLNLLEEKGILKKTFKGRLTLYSLNTEHPNIIDYISLTEKNKLIKKCEKELIIKEIVEFAYKTFDENTKVLIFGSATENANKANDIDLLVIGKTHREEIESFAKKINKEIQTIEVKNIKQITDTLKKEIIKKHLIIKGSEEIIRWMLW